MPVALGADKPLKRELNAFSNVHGHNGIGNVELPVSTQEPLKEKAADFILRKSHELSGELSIITLGRLTNLAHALLKDPSLANRIKHVYVMGGAVQSAGNVTPVAEANIWGDPEAADLVFSSGMAITMVGLDVTMKTNITKEHLEDLKQHCQKENQEMVAFIENALTFYFDFYRASNYLRDAAPMHDPLTVLMAIDPYIMKTQQMKIKVECEGELCLGMTVADRRPNPAIGTPIQVCVDVDADLAVQKMLAVF